MTNHKANPMKIFIETFGLALALTLALFAGQASAQDAGNQGDGAVSFQTFYDQLADQGTWIQTDQYGYVFQPAESDPDWRPYTYGHWVNTDAGMTWVSDDPFGWATDHYGRWVNLDDYGWVWVPGYTWAPAWVSWREDDDEVGWAPLPPDSQEGIDFYDEDDYFTGVDSGFNIGDDCDIAYGIGPWFYNFCPVEYIGDRDCWRHFRDRRDNFALIGHTRNVTNINFRRDGTGRFGHVLAGGPSVAFLNARARTQIAQAELASASQFGTAGLRDKTLAVYAPRFDPATLKTAEPAFVGGSLTNASANRGTDINHPLAVNSEISPAGPTTAQIQAAMVAQRELPAKAGIATAETSFSRQLTQPLTSLRTATRSSESAETNRDTARSSYTESRYITEPLMEHPTFSSSEESRHRGEPMAPSSVTPAFHGGPSYFSGQNDYHPSSVYHASPSYIHSSAPAYSYPQASSHSITPAPQSRYSGGYSGGGGVHASVGGGGGYTGGRGGYR